MELIVTWCHSGQENMKIQRGWMCIWIRTFRVVIINANKKNIGREIIPYISGFKSISKCLRLGWGWHSGRLLDNCLLWVSYTFLWSTFLGHCWRQESGWGKWQVWSSMTIPMFLNRIWCSSYLCKCLRDTAIESFSELHGFWYGFSKIRGKDLQLV